MEKAREGEIARTVLKYILRKKNIQLDSSDFKRRLGNIAKATKISFEELTEFSEKLVRELMDEMFAKSKKN